MRVDGRELWHAAASHPEPGTGMATKAIRPWSEARLRERAHGQLPGLKHELTEQPELELG